MTQFSNFLIFLATCLAKIEINPLQVAEDMLHVAILGCTCSVSKKYLQSLQQVDLSSTASVTWCNFLCNLCCNGVERKATGRLQRLTHPLCNLSCNFFGFATAPQSRALFHVLQRLHEGFLNPLQVAAPDCNV